MRSLMSLFMLFRRCSENGTKNNSSGNRLSTRKKNNSGTTELGRSALHPERSPCIDANVRCKRARRSASLHMPPAGLQCDVLACKVTCMRARGLCRLAYRRARLQSDLHACIRLCWLAVLFACVHLPRACMQTREQACRATCWLARAGLHEPCGRMHSRVLACKAMG